MSENKAAPTPVVRGPHVKYINRRETHTSRALLAVIVALLLMAAVIYLVVESVFSLLGRRPLLVKPGEIGSYVANFGSEVDRLIPASVIAVGAVVALVGLFLVFKAILPGRLRRHTLRDERIAVVVDDAVMAADVSRRLRRANNLDEGQVTTSVARRAITAHITPTSGRPIAESMIQGQVQEIVDTWGAQPELKVRAAIKDEGVVGR